MVQFLQKQTRDLWIINLQEGVTGLIESSKTTRKGSCYKTLFRGFSVKRWFRNMRIIFKFEELVFERQIRLFWVAKECFYELLHRGYRDILVSQNILLNFAKKEWLQCKIASFINWIVSLYVCSVHPFSKELQIPVSRHHSAVWGYDYTEDKVP